MANEAVLREKLEEPIDFTVADGTGIEKGSLCALTDPRTAALAAAEGCALAGITAREKVASDGRTRLACFRKGIFDMKASGAILVGSPVMSAALAGSGSENMVKVAQGILVSGACVLGYALETAADAEVIQVLVDIGAGSTA